MDAEQKTLPPHQGETMTYSRLGALDVDIRPLDTALADPPLGAFPTEQWTAHPLPYSRGFAIDGPTAYVQAGDYAEQGIKALGTWGGMTKGRIARSKIFNYAGGRAVVRTAATTGATALVVNSLCGFRHKPTQGGLVPVSASNALAILVGGAPNTVTGVTPADAAFPDGPGTLTLGTALAGNVAAQTPVESSVAPFLIRAGGKSSTEQLTAADLPKVLDLKRGVAWMVGRGIPKFDDGTYHLHADETFSLGIVQDPLWQSQLNGAGLVSIFGMVGLFVPALGITIFETNDSPALSRGVEVSVGASPGDSVSMKDLGLDVVNSTGVGVRRAVLVGKGALVETRINQTLYWSEFGIKKIADLSPNLGLFQMGGAMFVSGELEGWVFTIQPALDIRNLKTIIGVSNVLDYTLPTDINNQTGGNKGPAAASARPIKRAVVFEWGNAE